MNLFKLCSELAALFERKHQIELEIMRIEAKKEDLDSEVAALEVRARVAAQRLETVRVGLLTTSDGEQRGGSTPPPGNPSK